MAINPYQSVIPGTEGNKPYPNPYQSVAPNTMGNVIADDLVDRLPQGQNLPNFAKTPTPIASVTTVPKTDFNNVQGNTLPLSLPDTTPKPSTLGGMTDEEAANLRKRFGLPDIPSFDTAGFNTARSGLKSAQEEELATYDKTPQQRQLEGELGGLQDQLDTLNLSERKGQLALEQNRYNVMPLLSGQQAELSRQAQFARGDVLNQIESKQRSLGFIIEERKMAQDKAKAKAGFAKGNIDEFKDAQKRIDDMQKNQADIEGKILDWSFKLDDRSRTALGTIASSFKDATTSFEQMTPQAQQGIINMANQFGIDPKGVIAVLNAQVDSNVLASRKDEVTTVHNLAQKYPDAGITTQDTFESAQAKVVNSTSYKLETAKTLKGLEDTGAVSEREKDILKKAYTIASPLMLPGISGYVDPEKYVQIREDFSLNVGDPSKFDELFSARLSPADRARLGIGKAVGEVAETSVSAPPAQMIQKYKDSGWTRAEFEGKYKTEFKVTDIPDEIADALDEIYGEEPSFWDFLKTNPIEQMVK